MVRKIVKYLGFFIEYVLLSSHITCKKCVINCKPEMEKKVEKSESSESKCILQKQNNINVRIKKMVFKIVKNK